MKSPLSGKKMKLISENDKLKYNNKLYDVEYYYYLCDITNEKFTTIELDNLNKEYVKDIFKKL
jgi:hypothetical protein